MNVYQTWKERAVIYFSHIDEVQNLYLLHFGIYIPIISARRPKVVKKFRDYGYSATS